MSGKARVTKAQKEEYKKKMEVSQPVFKLQVTGEDRTMCKYIGVIEKVEELRDEPIELPGPGGILKFADQGKYEIIGRACQCYIPAGFLLKNKKSMHEN